MDSRSLKRHTEDGALLGQPPLVGMMSRQGSRGSENDDSCSYFEVVRPGGLDSIYIATIADGVTSSVGGACASRIAVETIQANLQNGPGRAETISEWLEFSIRQANDEILFEAQRQPEYESMSTTIVVAALVGSKLYAMHLGDSRAYLARDGRIFQLTADHTWAEEAMHAGTLSAAEAKEHPGRNQLQRYLGARYEIQVDRGIIDPVTGLHEEYLRIQPGDTVLLSTDGVHSRVTGEEIQGTLLNNVGYPQDAVDELVNKALEKGERDDITAVALQMPPERKDAKANAWDDEPTVSFESSETGSGSKQYLITGLAILVALLLLLLYLSGMGQ